jgi:hypothetical protein
MLKFQNKWFNCVEDLMEYVYTQYGYSCVADLDHNLEEEIQDVESFISSYDEWQKQEENKYVE